ncbi:LysR family transcriptional regulator [Gluconacetobacter entanii]|uniref:LysR family transcriptional regulator n=1 Tax=Gluconacetobacter entanii TaxID=108528 RepID=A0A318PWT1_9PROT|nr:LysR family transcriptional regulator [Gluconacetobacter entanii]MBE7620010.1 LysR family transcriptional regulator [Komagataeibacter sp. FXV2]MCE2579976.1 LysR family transcriptional regulator [Komagataeibacter sp. FNDCR1]MCW4592013.1 LysR family transcriptional regulator [Gluconacetobacter entanii]MCW4595242.1 LysR family transcriptional regulator [Gluconacetobacter entanii]NPC88938.1 LysR family transcriptional regulator [Gluconacetobacter entanii]
MSEPVLRTPRMMRLHARGISYFNAVRECRSIREAARRLNVTPSALTRQLAQMEAEVGAPLFDRLPEGMVLTEVGRIMARHIVTVMQDAARTEEQINALSGRQDGRLRIMAVEGVTGQLLPPLLERITRMYPAVDLNVEIGSPKNIVSALQDGSVDLGIAFSLALYPDLRRVAVAHFPVGAVVRPDHPVAHLRTVTIEECVRHRLILPTRTLSLYRVMEPMLRPWHEHLHVVLHTGSIELTNRMVAAGSGLAFQSPLAVEMQAGHERLCHVPLRDTRAVTDLGVYVRESRWLPPLLETVIEELRQELRRIQGVGDEQVL